MVAWPRYEDKPRDGYLEADPQDMSSNHVSTPVRAQEDLEVWSWRATPVAAVIDLPKELVEVVDILRGRLNKRDSRPLRLHLSGYLCSGQVVSCHYCCGQLLVESY